MSDLTDGSGFPLGLTAGTPGNLVLGWQNEAMTGPVVVSSAVSGLGPEQLQNDQGGASTAWQTPAGTTSASILLTRPAGTRWRAFALARTNLSPGAVVTWNVLDGAAATFVATSDPVVPGFGQAVMVAPDEVTGDTMQVNISDPGNADGFLSAALLYAGPVWQPARNYGYASAILAEEGTVETRTRAGAEYVRNDWTRRGFDLSLGAVAPEEVWARVLVLDRYARRGGNVLLVPSPGGAQQNTQAVFGRLKPTAPIGYANNSARTRTWRATIMERL